MEYLTGINVYWNRFDFSQIRKMKMTDVEFDKYHLEKGDLIICEGGDAGRCAVWSSDKKIAYQKALHRARFYCNVNPFFYMFVLMLYQDALILEPYITGTTIRHLTNVQIKKLYVPLPPLNEQQRILAKLDELLPIVEQYGKLQSSLDMLTNNLNNLLHKSILQEAIQGRLVPQDASDEPAYLLLQRIKDEKKRLVEEGKLKKKDVVNSTIFRGDDNKYFEKKGEVVQCFDGEIPFDIPNSWIWTRLSALAEIYTGNSISETEKKANFTNVVGRYYIGTKDVGFDNNVFYNNGVAIPKQYEQNFRIAPRNSILMCIEGGSAGRKIAIIDQDVCFGNKLCCFSPFVQIAKYIYYYLQSPSFIDMFNGNKTGIIGGVSIAKIKEILIPLPPQQEMNRIITKIDELVASIMSR